MSETHHPCLCCGYRTFAYPTGGSMDMCPVCGWEDIYGLADCEGAREFALADHQRLYLTTGIGNENFHGEVRPPLPEEARSIHWASFDELRLRVIQDIETAFHDVRRDGGVTLHQLDLVDGPCVPDPVELKEAARKDPEQAWQDIPAEKLSRFAESLSLFFLDDPGVLFHLPAFMRHALTSSHPAINEAGIESLLGFLAGGPDYHVWKNAFARFSSEQNSATASFVFLIATYGDGFQAARAIKGLRKGWQSFVPDFLKLAIL